MTTGAPRRLGKFLGWALAGLAGVAVAVFLVAWSGIFNVAASRGHWAVVDWFLAFGMRNSVELRANGDHAAAARQPRPHQARGGPLSRRLRLLSRRARHSRQSDRAPHAALPARSHDIDAAVEGRRAVLDRPARHQVHGHAGLGGAGARRRDLGRRGLPETNSDHRCGELSRARARRRSHTRPDRREARHRRIQSAGCRRLRALPWRRGQRARQRAGAGPPRPACRVPDDGLAGVRRRCAPQRHHAAAGGRSGSAGHAPAGGVLRETHAAQDAGPRHRQRIDRTRAPYWRPRAIPATASRRAMPVTAAMRSRAIRAWRARMPPTWRGNCASGRQDITPRPTAPRSWRRSHGA